MGFGTSAGGALTTGLALKEAIKLPLTYNQIGQVAHAAEIQCLTGLGTVSSLNFRRWTHPRHQTRCTRNLPNRPNPHITRLCYCSGLLSFTYPQEICPLLTREKAGN